MKCKTPKTSQTKTMPKPAKAAPKPKVNSIDQLRALGKSKGVKY